jgi:hypothetical protein
VVRVEIEEPVRRRDPHRLVVVLHPDVIEICGAAQGLFRDVEELRGMTPLSRGEGCPAAGASATAMGKVRIVMFGISGGRSLTQSLRDARRFPFT